MKTPMYFDVFCFFLPIFVDSCPCQHFGCPPKKDDQQRNSGHNNCPNKKIVQSIDFSGENSTENSRSEAEHELTALAFIRLLGAVHLVPGNAVGVDRLEGT